jgi:dipeptidyl aminopeptidase/acylaminoacyl peptidase
MFYLLARLVGCAAILAPFLSSAVTAATRGEPARPFTVADEIQLWSLLPHLDEPSGRFSPDGKYFAVYSARGRLDINRPEDSIRFYRSRDVKRLLDGGYDASQSVSPFWIIRLSSDIEGVIISDWRWLPDSSGIAFVQRMTHGYRRLVLADIREKVIEALTSPRESVRQFDIRDRSHYVYTTLGLQEIRRHGESQAPFVVGTGRQLYELVLPDDPEVIERFSTPHYQLWAVLGGDRFQIKHDGAPIVPSGDLALSPNGQSLVTKLLVAKVPKSWETLYPPPPSAPASYAIHWGSSEDSDHPTNEYVLIDLRTGSIQPLTDAPTGESARWWGLGPPDWSSDGHAVVLPGTFLRSDSTVRSRPCVVVVDLISNICTCVEMLKGEAEVGFHTILRVEFAREGKERVLVRFHDREHASLQRSEYRRTPGGTWKAISQVADMTGTEEHGLNLTIAQGLNDPPKLVASNADRSRVIWDPNPQLKTIEMGEASVYTWKDEEGRNFKGGLYKPINYEPGRRYPLVIQTHGFNESFFMPAGTAFPNGFAARALAAAGFVVLQVGEACPSGDAAEGPCVVSAYESGLRKLVSDGLVDRERIGIIGFSRSCYYVMEMLTTSSIHLKAALITDGWMLSYSQYMQWPSWFSMEGNAMIGAAPFGEGLQQWLKRSPEFNLAKITTPLLVVADGPFDALLMWQPYAALHYLNRPADFIMLSTHEHILTNPAVREVSQGGSVDWFRFWLQGYEVPSPAKAEQYQRWESLCDTQLAQDPNQPAFCVRTKAH